MPSIQITVDPERLLPPSDEAVVVEEIGEYPQACQALRLALRTGAPLLLCVRNRTVAAWMREIASFYGEELVTIAQCTPRTELESRWQIPIPSDVTDHEIMAAGLLNEGVTPRTGQRFDDVLLEHFCGGMFTFTQLPVANLGALFSAYGPEKQKSIAERPLVAKVLRDRLCQWEKTAPNEAVRALVRRLMDNPETLRRDLCSYKVLRNYPAKLGAKVLKGTWGTLRKAAVGTEELGLTDQDTAEAATEIDYHLAAVKGSLSDAGDVAALADQMSGCHKREAYFLEDLLHEHPEWVSLELVRKIERVFTPIQDGIASQMSALRKLIMPPFPDQPSQEWDAQVWLAWVRDSYMPYYAWLEGQGRRDGTLQGYACMFADWLYDNYLAVKNGSPERFSFAALHRQIPKINESDRVTVVLLIDNLNYQFIECALSILMSRIRRQDAFVAISGPSDRF